MKKGENYRFTKQEIILRFFAFYDSHSKYTGKLSTFLNTYMHSNQNIDEKHIKEKEDIFNKTIKLIFEKIFNKSPPKKLSLTIMEALLLGVAKNINSLTNKTNNQLVVMYELLLAQDEFSEASLVEGLAQKKKVIDRLNKSIEVFGS